LADISNITKVRKNIERCVGRHVQLKTSKGRKKAVIWEGILESTYECIFTIKIDTDIDNSCERRATFSYTDLLMKTIELSVTIGDKRYHLS
jgi:uncharacterized protein Veg